MTRPLDKHLSNDEIDVLITLTGDTSASQDLKGAQAFEDARRHFESCEICGRRVEMHRRIEADMLELNKAETNSSKCPAGVDWVAVASGAARGKEAMELLDHAARCGRCGPLLKEATSFLSDEASAEELELLKKLGSTDTAWQRDLAAELAKATRGEMRAARKGPWFRVPSLGMMAWAGAMAGLAVVAVLSIREIARPNVDQLLGKAYAETQLMEPRIPGAGYALDRRERGDAKPALERSQALRDAFTLIDRELKSHPNDPRWLQARARAEMLELDYTSALQDLNRCLEIQPDSPSVMIDIASAYYERASRNEDLVSDYGKAVDYLGRALARASDDPIALFNRALAEERLKLYEPAISDWRHYLRVDPEGPWADEARRRLAGAEKNVSLKKQSLLRQLRSVTDIASSISDPSIAVSIDSRIEDYLQVASRQWLKLAYPLPTDVSTGGSADADVALGMVAATTRERHDDLWLTDVLTGSHAGGFSSAVRALSEAIRLNENGDYAAAKRMSSQAVGLFRRTGNVAGELRAEFEEAYSFHLLYEGPQCLALVHDINSRLSGHRYAWLRAQTTLEESNCAGLVGQLGVTEQAATRGTDEAEAHGYTGLALRGLGFQADLSASLGQTQKSFALASRGLDRFWSDSSDAMKGYNLYTDIDTAADVLRLPYLQVCLWQQATALADLHPDIVQRAMAHRWYGNSAYLADMPEIATREFGTASRLFDSAPRTEATARGEMDADIWLAGLELRHGDLQQAETLLEKVKFNLNQFPAFAPAIGFYNAEAEVAQQRRDVQETESAIRSAIFLAEWALRSFPSERVRREWAKQTEPAYRSLVTWKIGQGDALGALELWEWYRGADLREEATGLQTPAHDLANAVPPDAANAGPIAVPSAVSERISLEHEKTFITYAAFRDGLAIWVYDDRGVHLQWIEEARADLEERVRRFRRLCSTPESDLTAVHSAGRTLYDLLIGPVRQYLSSGRTLVFEPDDILNAVPMDALVDETGHYLIERTAVVVSPGFYRTQRLRVAAPLNRSTRVLVVSVPVVSELSLPALPDAEVEAEIVASRFDDARFLRGTAADLPTIRTELAGAEVFHFAGHALALPELNGLMLAKADEATQRPVLVNSENVGARNLEHLRLAVLSACDTSLTPETGNSGTENLAQTMLSAGVPDVVASRWKVDSAGTSALMQAFYAHLLDGNLVSSSLRSAELQLVFSTKFAHPYFWAAFGVQGL